MKRDELLAQLHQLVVAYRPAPHTVSQVKEVSLLMVIGPSGSGKTTIINAVKLPFVPSDTTRDARPGEVDGKDLFFLTNYDKVYEDISLGNFLQVAIGASGDLYATKPTSYPVSGVCVMPVMADVVPTFRAIGFKSTVSLFITPPTYLEWMKRLSTHAMDAEALDRRLAEAYRSFSFALADDQMHFILNDEVDKAVFQINELINSRIQSVRELTARSAAEEIFSHLK